MSGPLAGLRVVNTRAVHQAAELDQLLSEKGAISFSYPCIAIVPPQDSWDLDSALEPLVAGYFDWLILTSVNTAYALGRRLREVGLPVRLRSRTKVASVGPATAAAVRREFGADPEVVPATHTGLELFRALSMRKDESVLFPRSEIADPKLEAVLRMRSTRVRPVVAYRTVTGEGGADVPGLLADRQIDVLTFCSSSAVDGFVARMRREGGSLADAMSLPTFCIGPSTQATAVENGFESASRAEIHSLEGLVDAIERTFSVQSQGGSRWQ